MPIHNLGYREWSGELESSYSRWSVIAGIGIRRAWQSQWLRRVVLFAWVPGVVMGFLIFSYENVAQTGPREAAMFEKLIELLIHTGNRSDIIEGVLSQSASEKTLIEHRHEFWCSLLLTLFQRSQLMLLIPIVGMIAPGLVSQDLRSRAFLLYFSRPISKLQYILGKAATLFLYTSLITLCPGLVLYLVGVLLSPDISILYHTWDIPLRVFLVSAIVIIPSTVLALMLSSLTTESRFASFAWFTIWIFGFVAYTAVVPISGADANSAVQLISLYHLFVDLQAWVLDLDQTSTEGLETRITLLLTITVVSFIVLYRRISAPMEI